MDYSLWINYLRGKARRTALEQQLLDAADALLTDPFAREAESRAVEDIRNHPDLFALIPPSPAAAKGKRRAEAEPLQDGGV